MSSPPSRWRRDRALQRHGDRRHAAGRPIDGASSAPRTRRQWHARARSLTATYEGDDTFGTSTSLAEPHTVNRAATTTTISADTPDPSVVRRPVTVRYSVAAIAPGSGIPTGNVTVTDGVNRCTATVAAGQCTVALATVGNRTLTATYAGSASFRGSSSSGRAHAVAPPSRSGGSRAAGPAAQHGRTAAATPAGPRHRRKPVHPRFHVPTGDST